LNDSGLTFPSSHTCLVETNKDPLTENLYGRQEVHTCTKIWRHFMLHSVAEETPKGSDLSQSIHDDDLRNNLTDSRIDCIRVRCSTRPEIDISSDEVVTRVGVSVRHGERSPLTLFEVAWAIRDGSTTGDPIQEPHDESPVNTKIGGGAPDHLVTHVGVGVFLHELEVSILQNAIVIGSPDGPVRIRGDVNRRTDDWKVDA